MAEPRNYAEVLARNYVPGRDFTVTFGDNNVDQCLLVSPHGGGIEPGSSEIMRAVAELGGWAFYDFAGYLRQGNKEALHITSTRFDEPTLTGLLSRAAFAVAFHGASSSEEAVAFVGGRWTLGRHALIEAINASWKEHGIRAEDATETPAAEHLRGLERDNLTNRGRLQEGVQIEFSRGARDLLFPPSCSREARGRRSKKLRPLARSMEGAIDYLRRTAAERLRQT
ncbi:MAG TPA: poly-gamma-glutamate hydrolase family protein [Bryobacteraceae bacterium]